MNDLLWAWLRIGMGLALLVGGGEFLVRGASRLATAVRISPLVIGLTVVAFGTSAPELAVSVQAALAGSADLAIGNVVGSNIFNVLFILGISALIVPLVVSSQLIRWDVPVMIGVSLLSARFRLGRKHQPAGRAGVCSRGSLRTPGGAFGKAGRKAAKFRPNSLNNGRNAIDQPRMRVSDLG